MRRKAGEQNTSWSYSDYTEIAAAGGGPDGKNVGLIVLSQNLGLVSFLQLHAVKLITSQTMLQKCGEDILLVRTSRGPVKKEKHKKRGIIVRHDRCKDLQSSRFCEERGYVITSMRSVCIKIVKE